VKRRRPELPVMMVTAYGDDERRRRAAAYGAVEFLTNPSTSTASRNSSDSCPRRRIERRHLALALPAPRRKPGPTFRPHEQVERWIPLPPGSAKAPRYPLSVPPVAFSTAATRRAEKASISASVRVASCGCSVTAIASDFLPSGRPLPS
jgi:CheY-like chemotaxis protein